MKKSIYQLLFMLCIMLGMQIVTVSDVKAAATTKPFAYESQENLETKTFELQPTTVVMYGTWRYDSKGGWFQLENGTYPHNGWQMIDDEWYYFNKWGYAATGWRKIGGKTYFFYSYTNSSVAHYGEMLTGYWDINKKTYCFNSNGSMFTGWKKNRTIWYYFKPGTGNMQQNGWLKIGSKWYYFNASGQMAANKFIGKYYVNGSGAMVTGWKQISGKWYYFSGSGVRQYGWKKISGKWYYLNNSGVMLTGWIYVDKKYYYMSGSGVMCTGWKKINGYWYYMNSSGVRLNNTCVGKYCLGYSGRMIDGHTTTSDMNSLESLYRIWGLGIHYGAEAIIGKPNYYTGSLGQNWWYKGRNYWGKPGLMCVFFYEGYSSVVEWTYTFNGNTTNNRNQCRELHERISNAFYHKEGNFDYCKASSNGVATYWDYWGYGSDAATFTVKWYVKNGNPEIKVILDSGQ